MIPQTIGTKVDRIKDKLRVATTPHKMRASRLKAILLSKKVANNG